LRRLIDVFDKTLAPWKNDFRLGTRLLDCDYQIMTPTPYISEKKAAMITWIGTVFFTLGAVLFGH
jgi:hypothetical protein